MNNNSQGPQQEEEKIYQDTVNNLLSERRSIDLLKRAVDELLPKKELSSCFCLLLCLGLGFLISSKIMGLESSSLVEFQLCDMIMTVHLAVFSCMFAAYSILLTFLSDSYTKVLAKVESSPGKSYLIGGIEYFESALFIFFLAVVFSMTYKGALVFGGNIGSCALLRGSGFSQRNIRILRLLLLASYYAFAIRTVLEIKSVIYNTTMFFRLSLVSKVGIFMKDSDNAVEEINDESI